jgi:hypothetical protein
MSIIKREDGLYWPEFDVSACYEWTNTELFTASLVIESCNNKRSIIHAGGNVGAYALKFAKAFDNVYVFEPDLTNFKCLALNTVDSKNIFQFRAALGDSSSQVSLTNDNPQNCGTFFINGKGNIPMITIDSFNLSDVDCIHLDVEGYEVSALMGALETIKRSNPLIVIEWLDHGEKYGWTKQNILGFLSGLGYNNMKQIGSDMMFKR